jgi:general secretion pathway protein G
MRRQKAFTLIELLVVMAIIATLMTIAVPRYFSSLENSRETALRQSLSVMREALDHYYGDTGHYPESLDDMVDSSLPAQPAPGPDHRAQRHVGHRSAAGRRAGFGGGYQERIHREGA